MTDSQAEYSIEPTLQNCQDHSLRLEDSSEMTLWHCSTISPQAIASNKRAAGSPHTPTSSNTTVEMLDSKIKEHSLRLHAAKRALILKEQENLELKKKICRLKEHLYTDGAKNSDCNACIVF